MPLSFRQENEKSLQAAWKIAKKNEGKVLTRDPGLAGSMGNIRLLCRRGHTWETDTQKVANGRWCPKCFDIERRTVHLQELKSIARERGGRCLSKEYIKTHIKIQWKCKRGHIWWARPNNIKVGSWCPTCSHHEGHQKLKLPFEVIQKLASKRGGKCISKNYPNYRVKLTWECAQGHRWKAPARSVINGHWCPKCAGRRKTVLDMRALAAIRGGKCLSRKYLGVHAKLKWQCQKKHEWWATPSRVKTGNWCRRCSAKEGAKNSRLSIGEMRAIAKARGGKCLSKEYQRCDRHLLWRCAAGHQWWAPPSRIKFGSWCGPCFFEKRARSQRLGIQKMKDLAGERGGRCLSTEYLSLDRPLKWRCKLGHRFSALPRNVRVAENWCPKCRQIEGALKKRGRSGTNREGRNPSPIIG